MCTVLIKMTKSGNKYEPVTNTEKIHTCTLLGVGHIFHI